MESPEELSDADLTTAIKVLEAAAQLDQDDPRSVALQRAMSGLYKKWKRGRRQALRAQRQEADNEVLAATATANPKRIDDETAGCCDLVSSNTVVTIQ